MMTSTQNAREYALDQLQQGKITSAQANVLMVQSKSRRIGSYEKRRIEAGGLLSQKR